MSRKSLFSLLLCAVLIFVGAFLPRIWGCFLDVSTENKVQFDSVTNVRLEFIQSNVSLTEILGIAARSNQSVQIPADLPTRSEADITRIVAETVQKYCDASLIPPHVHVDTHIQSIVPHLKYERDSVRRSNIFWLITLGPKDQSWILDLIIDDQTGAVCSIHYDQPTLAATGSDSSKPLYEDKLDTLRIFRDLYLKELGDPFTSDSSVSVDSSISLSTDDGFASSSISWPDTVRGDCHVVFYVQENSFYTLLY